MGPDIRATPVGAELECHDDPGDDTESECNPENLEPELEDESVGRTPGPQVQSFEHREPRRQTYRERREDDVEGDSKCELQPRQEKGREVHWHSLTSIELPARDG